MNIHKSLILGHHKSLILGHHKDLMLVHHNGLMLGHHIGMILGQHCVLKYFAIIIKGLIVKVCDLLGFYLFSDVKLVYKID